MLLQLINWNESQNVLPSKVIKTKKHELAQCQKIQYFLAANWLSIKYPCNAPPRCPQKAQFKNICYSSYWKFNHVKWKVDISMSERHHGPRKTTIVGFCTLIAAVRAFVDKYVVLEPEYPAKYVPYHLLWGFVKLGILLVITVVLWVRVSTYYILFMFYVIVLPGICSHTSWVRTIWSCCLKKYIRD